MWLHYSCGRALRCIVMPLSITISIVWYFGDVKRTASRFLRDKMYLDLRSCHNFEYALFALLNWELKRDSLFACVSVLVPSTIASSFRVMCIHLPTAFRFIYFSIVTVTDFCTDMLWAKIKIYQMSCATTKIIRFHALVDKFVPGHEKFQHTNE